MDGRADGRTVNQNVWTNEEKTIREGEANIVSPTWSFLITRGREGGDRGTNNEYFRSDSLLFGLRFPSHPWSFFFAPRH